MTGDSHLNLVVQNKGINLFNAAHDFDSLAMARMAKTMPTITKINFHQQAQCFQFHLPIILFVPCQVNIFKHQEFTNRQACTQQLLSFISEKNCTLFLYLLPMKHIFLLLVFAIATSSCQAYAQLFC